jgi:3',5'-cyclic-nucleotide phosphodiesterase
MTELLGLVVILAVVATASLSKVGFGQEGISTETSTAKFVVIVLGAAGGLSEDNLSAYLLAPTGSTDFIALDAGTLLAGIRKAQIMGSLWDIHLPPQSTLTPEGWVLQNHIKAYLITHAHLDHVAGLVINSPDDTDKDILGITPTIDYLRDHLFNGKIWPNFTNEGEGFRLKKYRYIRLNPGQEHPISGTAMTVEPFILSHSAYPSTAFLIRSAGFYALYFGDTGPDAVEESARLKTVWTQVASLARDRKLRGIFLEISYPEGRPDELLFGHLTPSWLMKELHQLAKLVDPDNPEPALRGLTVVVTHVKPSFKRGPTPRDQVAKQLDELNDLGVRFVIAQQGQRIEF